MRQFLALSLVSCLLIPNPARADEPPAKQAQSNETKPSPVASEFKAIKQKTDAELRKHSAKFQKEYEAAKSESEREAVQIRGIEESAKVLGPAAEKLMPVLRQHPTDPAAVEALVWVVNSRRESALGNEAVELLIKHHLLNKQTIELANRNKRAPMEWTEKLLRAQLAAPELAAVDRPRVLLALAMVKQSQSQFPAMLEEMSPEQLQLMNQLYGPAMVAKFRKIDVPATEAESVRLFTELADKYAEQKVAGQLTYGSLAKSSIFEIQNLSIGKPAPEIAGEDLDGVKFKLSDYRGKVVMLSFWGTWCGPCMALVPHEREIVERFKGKPFALIGVNSDANKEQVHKALEKNKITWRSFWCGEKTVFGPIPTAWNVNGWPTVYVLDEKGIIRSKQAMGQSLDKVLAKLVAEVEVKK
jgi:thiol-disulfide isomerase/thioredoxin